MLQVTDILAVATGAADADRVGDRAPHRFSGAGAAPPVVVWNVIRHCNMTCPHCYAAATSTPSKRDLSTDEGLALIDGLAAAGTRVVIFSGGEPLLRPDVLQLIAHARDRGLHPQLSTNGVLIDDSMAGALAAAGVEYVGVSIDGPRSFNDDYRGMDGGFDRACEGLRNAKAAGMRTGMRMTLTAKNVAFLDEMIDTAVTLGVDRLYFSHLLYSGRGRAMAAFDLTPVECRTTLQHIFSRAEQLLAQGTPLGIVTGGNDSDGPLLLEWVRGRYGALAADRVRKLLARRGGNSAGEKILSIDHEGRVHPDQFWQQCTLGKVREQTVASILAHPMRSELAERANKLSGRCGSCRFIDICRGSHRERALAKTRDMWASDPACVMTDAEIAPADRAMEHV